MYEVSIDSLPGVGTTMNFMPQLCCGPSLKMLMVHSKQDNSRRAYSLRSYLKYIVGMWEEYCIIPGQRRGQVITIHLFTFTLCINPAGFYNDCMDTAHTELGCLPISDPSHAKSCVISSSSLLPEMSMVQWLWLALYQVRLPMHPCVACLWLLPWICFC